MTAIGVPSSSLNWDVPATGFTVNVVNPVDIPTQYISNVASLTVNTGSISALNLFSAGAKSNIPAATIPWSQTFSTDSDSYIRPISSTITGGYANAVVNFNYWNGSAEVAYTNSSPTLSVAWNTPTMTLSLGSLSGNTFLQTYTSTSYTITVTGMSSPSNYSNSASGTGGTVSNASASGTFTFTTPINKDNTSDTRTVTNSTIFTRPVTVTGTSYTATLNSTTSNPTATFTYPTLWVWTPSSFDVPVRNTYVSGTGFQSNVTVLGNQVKTFGANVTNSLTVPQAFWFAVRTAVSQPNTFKTGPTPSLLSDVSYVTNSVSLAPDSPPSGYVSEPYSLYGITLQPGTTYVSIS